MRQPSAADAAADDDDDDDDAEVHQLTHYWYSTWPDHQAPRATDQLLQLVLEVERRRFNVDTGRRSGPVIVHCRSSHFTQNPLTETVKQSVSCLCQYIVISCTACG